MTGEREKKTFVLATVMLYIIRNAPKITCCRFKRIILGKGKGRKEAVIPDEDRS